MQIGSVDRGRSRLELEITESAAVGDGAQVQILIDELRATRCQQPRSRQRKRSDRAGDHGLAKGLGLTTAAEGIETRMQLAELLADGCVEGQGFLFGRPIPAAEIPGLLAQHRTSGRVA